MLPLCLKTSILGRYKVILANLAPSSMQRFKVAKKVFEQHLVLLLFLGVDILSNKKVSHSIFGLSYDGSSRLDIPPFGSVIIIRGVLSFHIKQYLFLINFLAYFIYIVLVDFS